MNGYVTFDRSLQQWWSEFFPLQSRWKKHVVLAPFWGDLDGHLRISGRSTVWYQLYSKPVGAIVSSHIMAVVARANHDIEQFRHDTGFQATTVIVITWENMEPYWQSYWRTQEVITCISGLHEGLHSILSVAYVN